jgi:hypothetical protein
MYTNGSEVMLEQQEHLHKPYSCAAVGFSTAVDLLQTPYAPGSRLRQPLMLPTNVVYHTEQHHAVYGLQQLLGIPGER